MKIKKHKKLPSLNQCSIWILRFVKGTLRRLVAYLKAQAPKIHFSWLNCIFLSHNQTWNSPFIIKLYFLWSQLSSISKTELDTFRTTLVLKISNIFLQTHCGILIFFLLDIDEFSQELFPLVLFTPVYSPVAIAPKSMSEYTEICRLQRQYTACHRTQFWVYFLKNKTAYLRHLFGLSIQSILQHTENSSKNACQYTRLCRVSAYFFDVSPQDFIFLWSKLTRA